MAAYGIDTLDPGVSTRRVAVLLDQLPSWARGPGESWSTEAHLLALVVDHLAQLTWVTLKANGAKMAPRPKPLQRPSERGAKREPLTGQPRSGGWSEAIMALAGMPGVEVTQHG